MKSKWKSTKDLHCEYDISVIIPTYNRASLLTGLLEWWRKVDLVTKYNYELIFSDDGSTDETVALLKGNTDLPIVIIENEHGGASKARNVAIKRAKGKKLLIMGDDIFPNENIINQHFEKLNLLESTDAVLGYCCWHPDIRINHLMIHITELGCEQFSYPNFPPNGFTDFRHFYTCNLSIDREFILSERHIFDESFYLYGYEDVELGYRLAKKGLRVYYYPEAIGYHYHPFHSVQKFCNRQEAAGEMAVVFKALHPEIESVIDVNFIQSKWFPYSLNNKIREQGPSIYEEIIIFMQYVEDNFGKSLAALTTDLSTIYKILFRFAFEKGVNSKYNFLVNKIVKELFVTNQLLIALQLINEFCHVPNYQKIYNIIHNTVRHLLTIEAIDGEHLNQLTTTYHQLRHIVSFRLKSSLGFTGYIYKPQKGFLIHENNLREILLFIQTNPGIDCIFLSFGLVDLPYVGIVESISNGLILRDDLVEFNDLLNVVKIRNGKIVRIFGKYGADKVHFTKYLEGYSTSIDIYGYFGVNSKKICENSQLLNCQKKQTGKPIIFILSTFLAVGGVERNTIEIVRRLNDRFDFIVITFEQLSEKHGSLHHQYLEHCVGIYDLTEIATHDNILAFMKILDRLYQPDLIWICNGCPWLAENTMAIRKIFSRIPIVDQEVYDTESGWIKLYKEKDQGLLKFDQYIAINSKIRNIFLEEVGLNQERVQLIYSAISIEKREEAMQNDRDVLCKKFSLDGSKKYVVFIGRLTEQKAPLDLLKLIRLIVKNNSFDFHFIMVGAGELSNEVSQYIKNNSLEKNVTQIEYVNNTFELCIIAEAIIFTSLYEGLSIALLEALSVGTPGLSTDVGDTNLLFESYKNGKIFREIGNIASYQETFHEFFRDYSFYKQNAIEFKDIIADRFSPEFISLQYERCFNNAIEMKLGSEI